MIKVPPELVSGEGSLLGLQTAASSPSPLTTFAQCMSLEAEVMGLGPHDYS